jgi:hypothetical protein
MARRPKEYPAEPRKVAPTHPRRVIGDMLDDQRISDSLMKKGWCGFQHRAASNGELPFFKKPQPRGVGPLACLACQLKDIATLA